MKAWYESKIQQRFEEWCTLIETNPKQALNCMADIRNYRALLVQRNS